MKEEGFTLIELLVVVAIIGILAAVGVVAYNGYTKSAKKTKCLEQSKFFEKELLRKLFGLKNSVISIGKGQCVRDFRDNLVHENNWNECNKEKKK